MEASAEKQVTGLEEDQPGTEGHMQAEAQPCESAREVVLKRLCAARESGHGDGLHKPDLRGIKLIDEDLSGIDFSGCDLSGVELSRARLCNANLSGCLLQGTSFYQAQLDGCEFMQSDLSDANLDECSANRAGFGGTKLDGASLIHAALEGATLSKATLKGTDLSTANLQKARIREADLTHADFNRADLRHADLEGSHVPGALFKGADLRGAQLKWISDFDRASWIGTDIRDVDFTGAYMVRRFIMDENYLYEFRHRSRYANFAYLVWWVTSDCGRSFTRWALWTALVALIFAGIFSLVDVHYGEYETFLSSIYYSVVTLTTLGYGDVHPASLAAQIFAMIEVALGYLALGGLLSIFANKMARRAD